MDNWIEESSALQEIFLKKRADICTCNNCVGDYDDAVDRTEWVFQYGHWKIPKKRTKRARPPIEEAQPKENDENDEGEEGQVA